MIGRGCGRGKRQIEKRDRTQQASDFDAHTKIEVLCNDGLVAQAVDVIQRAAHTGLAGDGWILVLQVEQAVRIITGERCNDEVDHERDSQAMEH